ncbi:hypothetical protein PICSAR240_00706 [Mycobacterium avium subsp. paratuberculosis]|nr:hypothetical protein D522_06210 [Mycobacterium avium subsp. paratuberculosis S5]OUZ02469.1 hypothetical protein B0172_03567 [Mycobacterium avium subsp. paratuberculosis]OVF04197.1 hypothetical protein B0173_01911 [Mycobacterium avium subsp. paratuberculosis]CAG6852047.1 hypothetical protein PICSAR107_00126 [Mycobacterium avium subsp. paratuberculosis]CAG6854553.1 hypothetical protein PICSAR11_00295 [Mycobacterium avium subsp. paratuberculosis]
MRIDVHRMDTIVIARHQVLGPRAVRKPCERTQLTGPSAARDVTENPHDIVVAYESVPSFSDLGVVVGRLGKPAEIGYEPMTDVEV